jgi:hypothetical protein
MDREERHKPLYPVTGGKGQIGPCFLRSNSEAWKDRFAEGNDRRQPAMFPACLGDFMIEATFLLSAVGNEVTHMA